MTHVKRPFSGPTITPHDRHTPPGTPFKHGHGPLREPAEQNGRQRTAPDVGFVHTDSESRTGMVHKTQQAVSGETYKQHLELSRGPRTTTPALTVAPRVHRNKLRPRRQV